MDNRTLWPERDFRLGVVARAITQDHDLFSVMADPLAFAGRRFPSGPAILLPQMPSVQLNVIEEEYELERWDGLS